MGFRWGLVLAMAVFITQFQLTPSFSVFVHTLVSKPMNAVAMVGDSVRMRCRREASSNAVEWEFCPTDSGNTTLIYTDRQIPENLTSRFKIDTDNKTRYDIVIDSVDTSHAGTYICTPVTPEEPRPQSGSAQLVVMESDPVCNTNASVSNGGNLEGDYISLWCTTNYSGNLLPIMEWKNNTGGRRVYTRSSGTGSTSTMYSPLYSHDDGVPFECKTTYTPGNYLMARRPTKDESRAENYPDYQYVWTFTPSVLFGPSSITIKPMESVYAVGDRLECSAKGNPSPAYEWLDVETKRTIDGPVLTIDGHMKSEMNHSFSCTAYNTVAGVRNQIAEEVTFQVFSTASTGFTMVNAGGLIAEIALGFAVALSLKTRH